MVKRLVRSNLLLLSLLFVVFSAFFVIAAHVVRTSTGETSFNVDEDVGFVYNISINNTDAGQNANITQVNITLPSGFSFVPGAKNGTNTLGAFGNTTNVLSWSNFTYYLINGSATNSYFWFNATASIPGNYNFTITTLNGTGAFSANLSVTVNDTTAPVITLIAPVDGVSSTTSSYNFTFNLTDEGTISSCDLVVNSAKIHTTTSVNSTGGTNGMYNASFSTGSYTWSVNCTDGGDNTGNSTTRAFTVSAEEVAAVTATSPGGGSIMGQTYNPTSEQMASGYQLQIPKNTNVNFQVGDEVHTFKLASVTQTGVAFTISSSLIEDTLNLGQTKKYDLNADGVYDLSVYLDSISLGRASFVFTTISEAASVMASPQIAEEQTEEEILQYSPLFDEQGKLLWWIVGLLVLVLVIIVVLLNQKKFSRK